MSQAKLPSAPAADLASHAMAAEARLAEQVLGAQRQVSDMTLAFANEVMDFTARRMKAQAEFVTRLGRCTDAADLLDAQWRFVTDTAQDYAAEMSTLTKVMQPQA